MTNTTPQRPTAGGRYYKQPDGSLLSEAEAATQPAPQPPAEPKAGKRNRFNERTTEDNASTAPSTEDTGE